MAFINEVVSQKDIEKYGLAELHEHYTKLANPYGFYDGLDSWQSWLVDREKEIWLMEVGHGVDSGDIPPMPTGENYYILHYKRKNIEVLMRRNRKKGSRKLSDNPFRMRWEILSISPGSFDDVSMQEIVDIVTVAMVAYGYAGVRKQLPSTQVTVKYVGGQN
jgi:hypothetical protein